MNFFKLFTIIGLIIQNRNFISVFKSGVAPVIFQFIIVILLSIFYIFAFVICFYAFREFKGMFFDYSGKTGSGLMNLPGIAGASSSAA